MVYQTFYSQFPTLPMKYLCHLGLTFLRSAITKRKINGRSYNSWDADGARDYCCIFMNIYINVWALMFWVKLFYWPKSKMILEEKKHLLKNFISIKCHSYIFFVKCYHLHHPWKHYENNSSKTFDRYILSYYIIIQWFIHIMCN